MTAPAKKYDINSVVSCFLKDEKLIKACVFGGGHINDTYVVKTEDKNGVERKYTLQRINHNVFKKPWEVMENIINVTVYLSDMIERDGGDKERGTLSFLFCKDGKSYCKDADGNYWRCYKYIDNARTYQEIEDGKLFYNVGEAFGKFQKYLADYPADTLHETIPLFHNTKDRLNNLRIAVKNDIVGRLREVEPELEKIFKRENDTGELVDKLEAGILPLKVTHNDTKVNNVLIDDDTKLGVCVIDLDTVMPGLAAYDFGDAIRVGASTGAEDEKDLSKVNFDIDLYSCFAKGFIGGTGGLLSKDEIESLPAGARIMTLENGIRFLTDYLNGDTYFKIHRPEHNLDRCRTQLRMVEHMEREYDEMMRIVREAGKLI